MPDNILENLSGQHVVLQHAEKKHDNKNWPIDQLIIYFFSWRQSMFLIQEEFMDKTG